MGDLQAIKERFDLLELVESDLGPGRRSGRWVNFHCPFPGHAHGDQNPSLTVTPDNGRYYCFTCGRSGDVLTWLTDYRELSWKEIFDVAGRAELLPAKPAYYDHYEPSKPAVLPRATWQTQAESFVQDSERLLWQPEGAKALDYLHRRGLNDDTINYNRLGFNPKVSYQSRQAWGLAPDPDRKSIKLYPGIVIPCYIAGILRYVKIRQSKGKPKYIHVTGGRPALFGADNLTGADVVLLTEGEFDCMLSAQLVGDSIGVATLGSAGQKLDLHVWGTYLLPARVILAALHADLAGERGLAYLTKLSPQIHPIRIPILRAGDKDINDYYLAGGDIWEWIKYTIHPQYLYSKRCLIDHLIDLGGVVKYEFLDL